MPKGSRPIRILLVGQIVSCEEIKRALRASPLKYRVNTATSVGKAERMLAKKRSVTVVLCDKDLKGGTWQSVLALTQAVASRPPVVVCSRLADMRLWAESLHLGAHDLLLTTPIHNEELVHVVESAHRSCPVIKQQTKSASR